jgi:hypothetical protein
MPETKKMSVFERAEEAGAYVALRAEALRSDPSVLAIRHTAETTDRRLADLGLQLAPPTPPEQPDLTDPDVRAIERMSTAAVADDNYRVQLIDLAALHGGLFLRAVDAIYPIEAQALGRFEALARRVLDRQQLDETRAKDAGITLQGVTGDGPTEG